MIEVTITLDDAHRAIIADGTFALECDGAPLYEEPLELAASKIEVLWSALSIAKDELELRPSFPEGDPEYSDTYEDES